MANIRNEENACLKNWISKHKKTDGKIRNPTIKEEFVKVRKEFKILVEKMFIDLISEEDFYKTSAMARVTSYLNIM